MVVYPYYLGLNLIPYNLTFFLIINSTDGYDLKKR